MPHPRTPDGSPMPPRPTALPPGGTGVHRPASPDPRPRRLAASPASHRAVAAFRRRCGWCGRPLRGWQINLCRTCRAAAEDPGASAPCSQGSRWDAAPDRRWSW